MRKYIPRSLALNLRAAKELHKISPHLFPVTALNAVASALLPYVTVFFSARILQELALYRREEMLWKWVVSGVLMTGLLAIGKSLLYQRFETLFDDIWGRKEILFCRKMFSLDFSDIDKQETHDLRAQIAQNENWAGWGMMKTPGTLRNLITNITGIVSGIGLTVGLFLSPVPKSAGKLTVLNHPLFILLFAAAMILVSLLAGKLTAKSIAYWGSVSEEATLDNRLFTYFGFLDRKKERNSDTGYNV